jgi:2-polyprenyl-6-methoxyphenol hydroxylase-like FAD-dependent oxidoreductase
MTSADVIVVGAGLAGTCAAETLARQGISVILVDPRAQCPPLFRAEKLEPDQVELLRKLRLFTNLLPHARRIREIQIGYNGHVCGAVPIEQYGISYSDMVNSLRSDNPLVQRRIGHVEHISNSDQTQRVTFRDGETLTSRLAVLSCGVGSELQARLGIRKSVIRKGQSLSLGFSIVKTDGTPFPFDAVTYYPNSNRERIDFLSLFLMGDAMRANLFTFTSTYDSWVRHFIAQPTRQLQRIFPKLRRLIGGFGIVGKIETGRVDLYEMREVAQPGVVLIGDTFQTACPSTGMGVSKVLTDVDVLGARAPQWLATPGMGVEKTATFYADERKHSVDASASQKAEYRRRAIVDASLRWRTHRLRLRLGMQFRRVAAPTFFSSAVSLEGKNA